MLNHRNYHCAIILAALVAMFFYGDARSQPAAAGMDNLWKKPANWPATEEQDRRPFANFYEQGQLPSHDSTASDDLGLKWEMPLRSSELEGKRIIDLGGVFCPTLAGRAKGGFGGRYRGIHRGHDIGVPISRLGNRKIPVHVIADGVYDGQRTYTHADPLPNDCKPLMVYHFPANNSKLTYTSIYCHLVPLPAAAGLRVGQKLKAGDVIGYLEDPKGAWSAHVHLELYTRPVYSSKDSTKFSRCGCSSDADCDDKTLKLKAIPRGCGIFEDDTFILEPVQFIKKKGGS